MTNIPTLTPCRFSSIKEITDLGDKCTYKSVRVMGKLISFDLGAYSATISDDKATMKIEISLIPEIELIINNRYEFLGDLRKNSEIGEIFIAVRTCRPVKSLNKNLYEVTTKLLSKLLDLYDGKQTNIEEQPMEVDQ